SRAASTSSCSVLMSSPQILVELGAQSVGVNDPGRNVSGYCDQLQQLPTHPVMRWPMHVECLPQRCHAGRHSGTPPQRQAYVDAGCSTTHQVWQRSSATVECDKSNGSRTGNGGLRSTQPAATTARAGPRRKDLR